MEADRSAAPWRSKGGSFPPRGATSERGRAAGAVTRASGITPPASSSSPSRTFAPAFTKKNLKRLTATGAPAEATSTLGTLAPDGLQEGTTVEHERFGKGKVIKIEGRAPDLKATVFFPAAGQKQLLLRFAKLTVVEG
jgi:hypothetical protein